MENEWKWQMTNKAEETIAAGRGLLSQNKGDTQDLGAPQMSRGRGQT